MNVKGVFIDIDLSSYNLDCVDGFDILKKNAYCFMLPFQYDDHTFSEDEISASKVNVFSTGDNKIHVAFKFKFEEHETLNIDLLKRSIFLLIKLGDDYFPVDEYKVLDILDL